MADTLDFDLTIRRGDTKEWDLTVTRNGVAENITGWSVWFTAKDNIRKADSDAKVRLTVGSGITITNGAGAIARSRMAPSVTASMILTQDLVLTADVQVKNGAGDVYTLLTGRLTIKPDVTRSA